LLAPLRQRRVVVNPAGQQRRSGDDDTPPGEVPGRGLDRRAGPAHGDPANRRAEPDDIVTEAGRQPERDQLGSPGEPVLLRAARRGDQLLEGPS
jgi:hypothetical protein